MSITFLNWTSRVAIAGRVAEMHRQFHSSNEPTIQGTYRLPLGKIDARTEALNWIWRC